MPHAGAIQDVLAAASQIEKLEFLDLEGQAFSGTLPKQYNFPNLLALNLINNNIGVGLQIIHYMKALCDMAQASAAAPPACMRYTGLCMHALQLLISTELPTAAASLRPAWPLWQVPAWAVGFYQLE